MDRFSEPTDRIGKNTRNYIEEFSADGADGRYPCDQLTSDSAAARPELERHTAAMPRVLFQNRNPPRLTNDS